MVTELNLHHGEALFESRHEIVNAANQFASKNEIGCLIPIPEKNTKLSIVIPVYNEAKLIIRCLDALNSQTNLNFEAIMVDNNSTDESAAIIRNYAESEAKYKLYLLSETKKGPGHARRCGMNQAAIRQTLSNGIDYIAGTDGDSMPSPTWVQDIYSSFSNSEFDLLAGNVEFFWGIENNELSELHFYDSFRKLTSKLGRPRLRGLNFAIRAKKYMEINGIVQPYTKEGMIKTGEEGSLISGVEESGGKIGYLDSNVKGDPRRLLENLMKGSEATLSLFENSVMTDVREFDNLIALNVSSENIQMFIERRLKGLFRKDCLELFKKQSTRDLYWSKTKIFLGDKASEFEFDVLAGIDNLDLLWEKYGLIFVENIQKLANQG